MFYDKNLKMSITSWLFKTFKLGKLKAVRAFGKLLPVLEAVISNQKLNRSAVNQCGIPFEIFPKNHQPRLHVAIRNGGVGQRAVKAMILKYFEGNI